MRVKTKNALAGMAQWIECQAAKQRVAGSITGLRHMPGLWAGPQKWVCNRQPYIHVSLPLFLPSFLSLKINKEDLKKSKMVNFYVVILIFKMEENTQHFQHIMRCHFKKGKNATETHKTRFVQCMENVL